MPAAARRSPALGWGSSLASGLAVIGASTLVAVTVHHRWSWPLFVWGVAWGPVVSAYAYFSTRAFGHVLARRGSDADRDQLRVKLDELWPRYRALYAGLVLFGLGIGILAGGLHSAAVDLVATIGWVVVGVLPPLVLVPILLRRADRVSRRPS